MEDIQNNDFHPIIEFRSVEQTEQQIEVVVASTILIEPSSYGFVSDHAAVLWGGATPPVKSEIFH